MDRWTVRQEGEKRRTDIGKEVDENTNSRTDEDIRERGPGGTGTEAFGPSRRSC